MRIRIQLFTSLRIRIMVITKSWILTWKIYFMWAPVQRCISLLLRGYKGHFERLKIRFLCLFWSIFLIKDPAFPIPVLIRIQEAKSMRIRIQNTALKSTSTVKPALRWLISLSSHYCNSTLPPSPTPPPALSMVKNVVVPGSLRSPRWEERCCWRPAHS